jgi:hypothetical protein
MKKIVLAVLLLPLLSGCQRNALDRLMGVDKEETKAETSTTQMQTMAVSSDFLVLNKTYRYAIVRRIANVQRGDMILTITINKNTGASTISGGFKTSPSITQHLALRGTYSKQPNGDEMFTLTSGLLNFQTFPSGSLLLPRTGYATLTLNGSASLPAAPPPVYTHPIPPAPAPNPAPPNPLPPAYTSPPYVPTTPGQAQPLNGTGQ